MNHNNFQLINFHLAFIFLSFLFSFNSDRIWLLFNWLIEFKVLQGAACHDLFFILSPIFKVPFILVYKLYFFDYVANFSNYDNWLILNNELVYLLFCIVLADINFKNIPIRIVLWYYQQTLSFKFK